MKRQIHNHSAHMPHFAFILGREYKLSLAELLQVFRAHDIKAELVSWSSEMAVFSSQRDLVPVFNRLGGSIKVAAVRSVSKEELAKDLSSLLKPNSQNKFHFGASVYKAQEGITAKQLNEFRQSLRQHLFTVRSAIKEKGISVRIVESKEDQLSSVVLRKNKLLTEQGAEILVGVAADQLFVGKTADAQDFEAFAARDFARPHRDDRSGMLPPKLARMMINLSGREITKKTVLLDPFCGSGTVLQEAVMLGAGKVLASDISDKAIEDTQQNLDWLRERGLRFDSSVEQVDVVEVDSWLPQQFVDVIVTEPYLGEPIRARLSGAEINERQQALADLYDRALQAMHRVLKKDGVLVMIFPFIETKRLPLPRSLKKQWETGVFPTEIISSERGGVDYKRANQSVGREIFVFVKK